MITESEYKHAQKKGIDLIKGTCLSIKEEEFANMSVADFGLGDLHTFGAQILTLINTNKVAVKLIAMHPYQILPEHWHPKIDRYEGKEETLRIEWGILYLYLPGEAAKHLTAKIPKIMGDFLKSRHELVMYPGDSFTIPPNTPHWFQAGQRGVVTWSISSQVFDLQDKFTDPRIKRKTIVKKNG
jgi:D-lyxose ketol-isomerase